VLTEAIKALASYRATPWLCKEFGASFLDCPGRDRYARFACLVNLVR
jgi:hypothetical protein